MSESFSIDLKLSYPRDKKDVAQKIWRAIVMRLMTAQAERSKDNPGLEALGRLTHKTFEAVLRQTVRPKLPPWIRITGLTVAYFSKPDTSGKPVMKVDCLTGKITIF